MLMATAATTRILENLLIVIDITDHARVQMTLLLLLACRRHGA